MCKKVDESVIMYIDTRCLLQVAGHSCIERTVQYNWRFLYNIFIVCFCIFVRHQLVEYFVFIDNI